MLHDVPRPAARQLSFVMSARFPHLRDMTQPEIAGFDIDCALPNVMLNIRVCDLVLRSHVVERELIRFLCCTQKCGRVMRNEACLPTLCKILARVPNDVFV